MIKRLMLLACWLVAPEALAAPGSDDLTALLAGQTITRPFSLEGMSGVEALFWVDAPVESAFRLLADTPRLAEFMPALRTCTILEAGDRYAIVKMVSEQGVMVQRRSYEPPDRITWQLVRAPGLKDMKGRWQMSPVAPRGTVLSYGVALEPAFLVPRPLIDHFQSRNLPALVRNVRARIESGGTWIKPDYRKK